MLGEQYRTLKYHFPMHSIPLPVQMVCPLFLQLRTPYKPKKPKRAWPAVMQLCLSLRCEKSVTRHPELQAVCSSCVLVAKLSKPPTAHPVFVGHPKPSEDPLFNWVVVRPCFTLDKGVLWWVTGGDMEAWSQIANGPEESF